MNSDHGDLDLRQHLVRLDIEGTETEKGHARLLDFLNTIGKVAGMFGRLDRTASADGKPSFYLRVVGLRHGSPAQVVLEQCLVDPKTDRRDLVRTQFFSRLTGIEEDEVVEGLDYGFLKLASELSQPIGQRIAAVCVSANGQRHLIGPQFRERLAKKLAPEETSEGFVRGMLEFINIHGTRPVFRIYPDVGPDQVACHFRREILPEAREGIGRFVEVRGTLKYKAIADYPHEIEASAIEILPSDKELPSFEDVRGLFPDLTAGLSTEEYVRQIRDVTED